MKVLVTGGAGFIGSHYVRMLASGAYPSWKDAEITVLDKLTYAGTLANLVPVDGRFHFVHGDICDADLLSRVVPGNDVLINFAAETHVDRSILSSAEFVHTNVLGIQKLMAVCLDAGVAQVVQVSTDEVYGSIATGSWAEDAPIDPNSPYAAAKAGGDLIALSYWRTHGLPVCVTRCGNNYGPYQHIEKVIPLFVTNLLDDVPLPLYGDGRNVRQWIHVDDHCRAIQLVAERGTPGEVYHIAGTRELTNIELTDQLLKAFGRTWDRVGHVADRKGHDRRYSLCDGKIRALGYRPAIDFERGLAETVGWYRANRSWWQRLRPASRASAHTAG